MQGAGAVPGCNHHIPSELIQAASFTPTVYLDQIYWQDKMKEYNKEDVKGLLETLSVPHNPPNR